MKSLNVRLADVLREVNRARKALCMAPLNRMPQGLVHMPRGSLAQALGASCAFAIASCEHCGNVEAQVGFLKELPGASEKVRTLRALWRPKRFIEVGGGYWLALPQVLAKFQRNFDSEMYPKLVIVLAKKVAG